MENLTAIFLCLFISFMIAAFVFFGGNRLKSFGDFLKQKGLGDMNKNATRKYFYMRLVISGIIFVFVFIMLYFNQGN